MNDTDLSAPLKSTGLFALSGADQQQFMNSSAFNSSNNSNYVCHSNEICHPVFTYSMSAVMSIATLLGILGNTMVILVILKSPKLHSITWGLLFNLAVSDFSISLFLLPMAVGVQLYRPSLSQSPDHRPIGCGFVGFFFITLGIVSIWTLTLLSIERYIAVVHPLHYHQKVTKHRAIVAVLILWLLAMLAGLLPIFIGTRYSYSEQYRMCLPDLTQKQAATLTTLCFGVCVPFFIMCVMYTYIGRIALTHAQRKVIECNEDHCTYVSPKNKDYRALKVLMVLALVFTTCWLPFAIVTILGIASSVNISYIECQLVICLTLLNAAINPWLYSILNRTFRISIKTMLGQYRMRFIFCFSPENRIKPSSREHNTDNAVPLNYVEQNPPDENDNGTQEIQLPNNTVREDTSSPLPNTMLAIKTSVVPKYGAAADR